ncbi:MAG: endonuclease domain-containing protein [Patescibacteria group bacterium]|jgi:very-short-patch-repair endonuclease
MKKLVKGGCFLPYNPELVERAKEMRKSPTLAERKLWHKLQDLSPRFLRQRPIDNFIVDFYCPKLKLAIEVDGGHHFNQEGKGHDLERTAILESYGLEVVRFTNDEILNNFDETIHRIIKLINRPLPKGTAPPSEGGAGDLF